MKNHTRSPTTGGLEVGIKRRVEVAANSSIVAGRGERYSLRLLEQGGVETAGRSAGRSQARRAKAAVTGRLKQSTRRASSHVKKGTLPVMQL